MPQGLGRKRIRSVGRHIATPDSEVRSSFRRDLGCAFVPPRNRNDGRTCRNSDVHGGGKREHIYHDQRVNVRSKVKCTLDAPVEAARKAMLSQRVHCHELNDRERSFDWIDELLAPIPVAT